MKSNKVGRIIRCPRCKLKETIDRAKDPEMEYIIEDLVLMIPNLDTDIGKMGHNVKCRTCQNTFRVDDEKAMVEYFGIKALKVINKVK